MKIAIIGKGTSAIITALRLIQDDHDVEFFYDPDKNPLSVGESTTPHIQSLILETLDISIGDLADAGIVSYKNGIKYIDWGVGGSFRHHFHGGEVAFHFESGILNPFIHNHLEKEHGIVYHAERVDEYDFEDEQVVINDKEYDYVVNCAGWDDESEYYKPIFETVNAAILYTSDTIDDVTYTLHRATRDGWEFGLPFPDRGITKHGYLYNRNLSSPEIEGKKISWTPRFSKKLLQNRFEAYNGNRLFFLEPLEALSLMYYHDFASSIAEFLKSDRDITKYQETNNYYLKNITAYSKSLAWYYSYGSIHDSPFWKLTQARSSVYLNSQCFSNRIDSMLEGYYAAKSLHDEEEILKIGCFGYHDFKDVHCGMLQKPIQEVLQDVFDYPLDPLHIQEETV
jgi:hypothetical protein